MKPFPLFLKLLLTSFGIHFTGIMLLKLTAHSVPAVQPQPLLIRHIQPFVLSEALDPSRKDPVERNSTPAKKNPSSSKESKKPKPSGPPSPTPRKTPPVRALSSESLNVPQLKDSAPLSNQKQKVKEATWMERILEYLEQAILLPEKEVVKAILTIDSHFKIEKLTLLECESTANRNYLMKWLSFQLPFAEPGFQGAELTISFHGI
jgi:hypothetical protein